MTDQPTVAWIEIPVTDLPKSVSFYADVFKWGMAITQMGPFDVAIFDGADTGGGGHLCEGTPPKDGGTVTHLTVPDTVEAAAERLASAGGALDGPIIDIPVGRYQYARDLDGNRIGLFELGNAA